MVLVARGGGSPEQGNREEIPLDSIPMSYEEGVGYIARTRESTLVETQADEVFVSYPAASFPAQSDGQLALARQFARADQVVEGKRRRIFFYAPNGKMFAQSDSESGLRLIK